MAKKTPSKAEAMFGKSFMAELKGKKMPAKAAKGKNPFPIVKKKDGGALTRKEAATARVANRADAAGYKKGGKPKKLAVGGPGVPDGAISMTATAAPQAGIGGNFPQTMTFANRSDMLTAPNQAAERAQALANEARARNMSSQPYTPMQPMSMPPRMPFPANGQMDPAAMRAYADEMRAYGEQMRSRIPMGRPMPAPGQPMPATQMQSPMAASQIQRPMAPSQIQQPTASGQIPADYVRYMMNRGGQ